MDKETNDQEKAEIIGKFEELLKNGPKSDIVIGAIELSGTMSKMHLPDDLFNDLPNKKRHWTMVTVDLRSNIIYGIMDSKIVVPGREINKEYGQSWKERAILVRNRLIPDLCGSSNP